MGPVQDFGWALHQLESGRSVTRIGWNAHHSLTLQRPDEHSKMSRPYIYMTVGGDAKDMQGARVPWVASHTDLLASDWEVVAA